MPRLVSENPSCVERKLRSEQIDRLKNIACAQQKALEERLATAMLELYGRMSAEKYLELLRNAVDAIISARRSLDTAIRNAELAELNRTTQP